MSIRFCLTVHQHCTGWEFRPLNPFSSRARPSSFTHLSVQLSTPTLMATRWRFTYLFPLEAQLEARVLMMSTNNVLSPANGAPIIVPSQDMVLGLYYTSLLRKGMPGEGMIFGSVEEVEQALAAGVVHKHAEVKARIRELNEEGEKVSRIYTTTPGRILLGSHLPMNPHVPFEVLNKELRKQEVQEVIDTVYRYCGQKESVIFCDHIMEIGFKEACNAGISFCRSDMLVPTDKNKIVDETRALVATFEEHHKQGIISEGERYQKTVDAWASCTDRIQVKMEKDIQARKFIDNVEQERNSIYMMTHSGAGDPATR